MGFIKSIRKTDEEESQEDLPLERINEFFDQHFYGFKKYMEVAGLWLEQRAIVKTLMKLWFLTVYAISTGSEFWGFYRTCQRNEASLEKVIDSIYETSMVLCIVLLYLNFQPKLTIIKSFLDYAVTDFQKMLRSKEADVFVEFANFSYKLAMIYLGLFMVFVPIAIVYPVAVPLLLNYIVPGNTSYEPIVITQIYLGFDSENHILLLLLSLLNFATAMVLCLNASSSALLFAIIFLVVKFKVLGCRLDKLYKRLDDEAVYMPVECDQNSLHRHIVELIQDHAECYEVLDQITAFTGNILFTALSLVLFDLTVSGTMIVYQLNNNREHCLKMGAAFCGALVSGFTLCFIGQVALDSSDEICHKAYASGWYRLPNRSRKLILLMILRSSESRGIRAGSFLKLNYETYNLIVSNSLSYIMVMISLL